MIKGCSRSFPRVLYQRKFKTVSEREAQSAIGGAWKLGLGAIDTFGAAASLSGCLDMVVDYHRHMEDERRLLDNIKTWEYMKKLGYDLTCEESAGDHQWKYWDQKIQDVLRWWLGISRDLT